MRTIRLEVVMDGSHVVAASCSETVAPLKGFWRRWSMRDQGAGERITQTTIIDGLRGVLRQALKDTNHG